MSTMGRLPDYQCFFNMFKPLSDGEGMVIITGMQKSGTTAIAKLLGAAIDQTVISDPLYRLFEKKDVDPRPCLFSGKTTIKTLWKKQQHFFSAPIGKDPDFVFILPELIKLFPKAKFMFIIRDPRDTIRSICNRLDLPGNIAGDNNKHYTIPSAWKDCIEGKNPHFPGTNYIEILAHRWVKMSQIYLENSHHCIRVNYEDFRAGKSNTISKIVRELNTVQEHDIDHMKDIQFQPRGNPNVSWEEFYGENQLKTIEDITRHVEERLKETHHTQQLPQ